jgi:4-hydroxy-3-polyprenylbenzoate decarboxylase
MQLRASEEKRQIPTCLTVVERFNASRGRCVANNSRMPSASSPSIANPRKKFVVGISGASGACYSLRLLELLLLQGHEVHLVVTDYGRRLLFDEAQIKNLTLEELLPKLAASSQAADFAKRLLIHPNKDVGAVIASGSFLHDGMVVLPCSSASLGQLATGSGSNLLTRAAMVTLKERRTLIVCHREMPLNLIDIRNMEQLALAGAILCSPNPGFYLLPKTINDIVDFTVGKVLDLLHVPHDLKTRWEDHGKA